LQADKYDYTWSKDKGDGEYAGELDQIKVDKDEGYEVFFIQELMNKHGLKKVKYSTFAVQKLKPSPEK
jgi:hypothetical protein